MKLLGDLSNREALGKGDLVVKISPRSIFPKISKKDIPGVKAFPPPSIGSQSRSERRRPQRARGSG